MAIRSFIIFFCISLPFLGLGVVFIIAAQKRKQKAQASQTWPTVAGAVKSARLAEAVQNDDDTGPTRSYTADVVYTYTVAGVVYESNQFSYGASGSSSRRAAEETVAKFPPGAPVTVHYNPANPFEAVLQTQAKGLNVFLVVGIALAVIGGMILCAGVAFTLIAALGAAAS